MPLRFSPRWMNMSTMKVIVSAYSCPERFSGYTYLFIRRGEAPIFSDSLLRPIPPERFATACSSIFQTALSPEGVEAKEFGGRRRPSCPQILLAFMDLICILLFT